LLALEDDDEDEKQQTILRLSESASAPVVVYSGRPKRMLKNSTQLVQHKNQVGLAPFHLKLRT